MSSRHPDRIVVDTSAVIAVLQQEPGWEDLSARLEVADERLISAATAVEIGIVAESRNPAVTMQRIVRDFGLTVIDVDQQHSERAIEAWRRFGKGRHRAALNFGDCFSYALAESLGAPLLATGEDFRASDIDVIP